MASHLPLTIEDVDLAPTVSNLSGKGIYASARLIVALARLAGPKVVLGKDDLNTSNPTSDDERAASIGRSTPQPSQVTLAFQKPAQRPPLLVRRKSSESSSSGASTPKPPGDTRLPVLEPPFREYANSNLASPASRQSQVTTASDATTSLPVSINPPSQMRGASPPPLRRPILLVKQSFAGSVTSGDTSTADSRSRTSACYPQLIPEDTDIVSAEHAQVYSRSDAPSTSPTRTVSFGMSDEQAQHQVKTFRSQTRYRFRGAKPKFSQESLSANGIVIADEEEDLPLTELLGSASKTVSARTQEDLPSTPKRDQRTQARVVTPQRMTSSTQMRYPRPSSGGMNPMSPIAFPGTPPRTPRNNSGVLPQSPGSRRTSYASSNGDSSSNRYSRQTIEVVVNGQRSANYVRRVEPGHNPH